MTARRLNRNKYSNTIRDLLGVDFHAERDFPTDDSGNGFDNIGDVLTISPVLMEKYLAAAETIASRAVGADPLPRSRSRSSTTPKTRTFAGSTAAPSKRRTGWSGRANTPSGSDFPDSAAKMPPVKLGFWMDGQLLNTISVETKPSKLVYFDPYSEEQMRLYLPEGDHVFRAGFIDDPFVKDLSDKDAYSNKKDKFLNSIVFVGPFPSKVERQSRKKIFICDPNSGAACVEKIVANLAHHAYRRPVTKPEVASLLKFVDLASAKANPPSREFSSR